jgi:hypothetical protein
MSAFPYKVVLETAITTPVPERRIGSGRSPAGIGSGDDIVRNGLGEKEKVTLRKNPPVSPFF